MDRKKYTIQFLKIFLLVLCCTIFFKGESVFASMQDEAVNYTLGETYKVAGPTREYYTFTLSKKSHVSMNVKYNEDYYGIILYNSQGKALFVGNNFEWKENKTTEVYSGTISRTLPKGKYYLEIEPSGNRFHYIQFNLRAEELITLPKGSISSLKSNRAGQMTVICNNVSQAIGYRIQYSTDYRFKKGVKTIYNASKSKVITNLKKGTKYYVKVCPFNIYDDGSYALGTNSAIKAVTIAK